MGNESGGLSRNQKREQALASQDLAKKRARLAIERETRRKTLQIASPLVFGLQFTRCSFIYIYSLIHSVIKCG